MLGVGNCWPPVSAGAGAEEAACIGRAVHECSSLVLETLPVLQKCDAGQTACSTKVSNKRACTLQKPDASEDFCAEGVMQWRSCIWRGSCHPEGKNPSLQCLSSALYWQSLASCLLRKENHLKGPDPFSQRGQKVHLELGSNKSTISTVPNYAHSTPYRCYK